MLVTKIIQPRVSNESTLLSLSLFLSYSPSSLFLYLRWKHQEEWSQIQRYSPQGIEHQRNSANNYNFRWETTVYIVARRTSLRNAAFMVPLVLSSSEFLVSEFPVPPRPAAVGRHPRQRLPFLELREIRFIPRHVRSDRLDSSTSCSSTDGRR